MPKQLTPAAGSGSPQRSPEESRGPCAVCGNPVLISQERERDTQGRYSHVACVSRPSQIPSPQIVSKGPCSVCGKQVLASEERVLNSDKTYRHLHCIDRQVPPAELKTLPPRREVQFQTTCISSVEIPGSKRAVLVYGTQGEIVFREFFLAEKNADEVPFAVSYRWRSDMEVPGVSSVAPLETVELQTEGESFTLKASNSGIFVLCQMLENDQTFWIDFIGHGLAKDPKASMMHMGVIFLHACVYPYVLWTDDNAYFRRGWVQQELLFPKLGLPASNQLKFSFSPASFPQALVHFLVALIQDEAQPSFVHFFSAASAQGSSLSAVVDGLTQLSGDSSAAAIVAKRLRQLTPALEDLQRGELAWKARNGGVLQQWMAGVSGADCAGFVAGLGDPAPAADAGEHVGGQAYDLQAACEAWGEVDFARTKQLYGKGVFGGSMAELAAHCVRYGLWRVGYEALLRCRDALASLRRQHRLPPLTWERPVGSSRTTGEHVACPELGG